MGVFEVDLKAVGLRKHGVRIKLQEQPFQILSLLLGHRGEVVTRRHPRRVAGTAEFVYAAVEARLALGEMELKSGNPRAGRTRLETLEEEASGQGFQLIVQKGDRRPGSCGSQAALRVRN